MFRILPRPGLLSLLWAVCAGASQAAPLVIDSFDTPTAPHTVARTNLKPMFFRDFGTTMVGGVRETTYHVYTNPGQAVAALAVGKGQISVAAGTGVLGEMLASWGAFTRPKGNDEGGPLLGLDLSHQHRAELSFSGVEYGLNINVVLYTHAPLNPDNPLYYTQAGLNVAPSAPGDPLTVTLAFNPADGFNYAQVDGIVLLVDRSGNATQNSYVLNQVQFLDD